MAVFAGKKSESDMTYDPMNDKIVASDLPPRYFLVILRLHSGVSRVGIDTLV